MTLSHFNGLLLEVKGRFYLGVLTCNLELIVVEKST